MKSSFQVYKNAQINTGQYGFSDAIRFKHNKSSQNNLKVCYILYI